MPTQATTNLTIGTILDLIGPAQPMHPGGKDQEAFDALLQPPKPTQPPPREHPPDSHEPPTTRPEPTPAVRGFEPLEDDRTTAAGSSDGQAELAEPPEEERLPAESENEAIEELPSLEAQPVAPLEAAVFVVAIDQSLKLTGDVKASNEAQAHEFEAPEERTGSVGGHKRAARRAALPNQPAHAAVTSDAPDSTVAARDGGLAQPTDESAQHAPLFESELQTNDIDAPSEQSNPRGEVESLTPLNEENETLPETIATTAVPAAEPVHKPEGKVSQQPGEHQHGGNAANQAATPLPEPPLASNADHAPLAALTIAPQSTASHSTPQQANPSAAAISSITPRQARLPAELLAHGAQASRRSAVVQVDSEKLLTRVARALAAAQTRDGEVRLRLSPPELGSLRLEIRIQDGAMVARVEAETEVAKTAIVENLPALRERLNEQGVRIERFDVDLMQRQTGGAPNQSDQRQAHESPAPLRVAPPLKRVSEPAAEMLRRSTVTPPGSLNVIV